MRYAPGNHEGPNRADKGVKGGSCNVTACQLPDSAHWFNHSTLRWYCEVCATELNRVNWDFPQMFDVKHQLCTHEAAAPKGE
jgi:hypothetical protein